MSDTITRLATYDVRLDILMPRTPLAEILTRATINALAVAIDRQDRTPLERAGMDTPLWAKGNPPAPGSVLRAALEQNAANLEEAHVRRRAAINAGHDTAPLDSRIYHLERAIRAGLNQLAQVRTRSGRPTSGAYNCRIPPLNVISSLDGPQVIEASVREVALTLEQWDSLTVWRREEHDRPRGPNVVYRVRSGAYELRDGLESVEKTLRAAVLASLHGMKAA
jgi:hypothetical protein